MTFDDSLIRAGDQCPECGSRGAESNGSTEFRCVSCDHRWGHDMGAAYGYDGYEDDDCADDDAPSFGPHYRPAD